jgi:hypothetical protein
MRFLGKFNSTALPYHQEPCKGGAMENTMLYSEKKWGQQGNFIEHALLHIMQRLLNARNKLHALINKGHALE